MKDEDIYQCPFCEEFNVVDKKELIVSNPTNKACKNCNKKVIITSYIDEYALKDDIVLKRFYLQYTEG